MGDFTVSGLMLNRMSKNQKIKLRFFSGARIKDILNYAVSSVDKKPDYVIPYKSRLEWSTGSKKFHQRKTSRWQKEYFVNANRWQWQWKSQEKISSS